MRKEAREPQAIVNGTSSPVAEQVSLRAVEPAACRRKRDIRVSVVVPAKNEAENIGWVLERLPDAVDEVVLVDGSSDDRTIEAALSVRPDTRVVRQRRPGKGVALRMGFQAARGDFIVMIDADGSMDPQEIDEFLSRLHERRLAPEALPVTARYPIVKGSRFMPGGGTDDMSLLRRTGNAALLRLVNFLYGASLTDLCYGLFAFRRDALDELDLASDGFEIETEIVARALREGLLIGEVASFEAPRRSGQSNLNTWRDGQRVLRTLLMHRWTRRGGRELVQETG